MLSAAPMPGASLIVKTLKDRRMLVLVTAIQQFRGTGTKVHIWYPVHYLPSPLMLLLPVGMMGPSQD